MDRGLRLRLAALMLCGLLAACAGTPPQPIAASVPAAAGQPSRTLRQVQETFDRYAPAFIALYNQRGRENAGRGRLLVAFGIAPDGSVSHCELLASTLNDPDFEQSVLQRVCKLNFGAQDVPPFEVLRYPINFIPR